MADIEELREFLLSIKSLFDYSQRTYHNRDSVGAGYCRTKLENYAAIIVAMAVAVTETESENRDMGLAALVSNLLGAMEDTRMMLSEVLETIPAENVRDGPSKLPSTGGRSAFCITKAQIEQLRETGMKWKAIANFLNISEKTLQRRGTEFGIYENFSDISDANLDKQVSEILQLTPYS